jgi:hypothetical protein
LEEEERADQKSESHQSVCRQEDEGSGNGHQSQIEKQA